MTTLSYIISKIQKQNTKKKHRLFVIEMCRYSKNLWLLEYYCIIMQLTQKNKLLFIFWWCDCKKKKNWIINKTESSEFDFFFLSSNNLFSNDSFLLEMICKTNKNPEVITKTKENMLVKNDVWNENWIFWYSDNDFTLFLMICSQNNFLTIFFFVCLWTLFLNCF